jgi:diguanylate cyclase (GGDEF)-like protein
MKDNSFNIRTQALIIISLLLLVVNIALGLLLMNQSRNAMKTMLNERLLDIANAAAYMIDGDVYENLTPGDKGTEAYQKVYYTLAYFTNYTTVEYVYGIRKSTKGRYIFTIDPAPENAAIFGEIVKENDAVRKLNEGRAVVTEEPYEDSYGSFYTAYGPIRNSYGNVVGFVAVDFDAKWYENQLSKSANTIMAGCLISLLIGSLIVMIATSRLRRRFRELNAEMQELAIDMNAFTKKVTGKSLQKEVVIDYNDIDAGVLDSNPSSHDEIYELGAQIRHMRENLQVHIDKVQALAYKDPLTGVKSKQFYAEQENKLNQQIMSGSLREFAIVACDLNNLKITNDTKGHKAGDELLRSASKLICDHYAHSPVFRTGGDEFEVILQGQDFENRQSILSAINKTVEQNLMEGKVVVAFGMSDFIPGEDKNLQDVFIRADEIMYRRKNDLKRMEAEKNKL